MCLYGNVKYKLPLILLVTTVDYLAQPPESPIFYMRNVVLVQINVVQLPATVMSTGWSHNIIRKYRVTVSVLHCNLKVQVGPTWAGGERRMEPPPGGCLRGPGAWGSQPGRTSCWASACAELTTRQWKVGNNFD